MSARAPAAVRLGPGHAVRRARPMLGTLVELGLALDVAPDPVAPAAERAGDAAPPWALEALSAGFRAAAAVEAAMSAFLPGSDVGRFNAAASGARLAVCEETAAVLRAADALRAGTAGRFDPTCGTGPRGWAIEGRLLAKREAGVRLDLGGIAKGHAVDRAVEAVARALADGGARVACWANAGGDLAVRGLALPVYLRDEEGGGARPWLLLRAGALATSHFGATPGRLAGGPVRARHVSVAAPRCLDCDALTKVVGLTGRADHPAIGERGGRAWIHA